MWHAAVQESSTRARRLPRAHAWVAGLLAIAAAACGSPADNPSQAGRAYIDLIHALPAAEQRSVLPHAQAIAVVDADVGGEIRPSLRTCGASRIIWTLSLPRKPVLRTAIAVDRSGSAGAGSLAFRIGIDDGRTYDGLFRQEFTPPWDATARGWQPVSVSLAGYQGWQWSLFYRPWKTRWRISFSLDARVSPDGRTECGLWATPRVESPR